MFALSELSTRRQTPLQVAFLGVIAGNRVQTSILIQSLGTVGFIVNVVSDLLQILEVGPGKV